MKLPGSNLLNKANLEALIARGLNYVHFPYLLECAYRRQYREEAAYEFRYRAPIIIILYLLLSSGIYQTIDDEQLAHEWFSYYVWVGIIILGAWIFSFFKALNQFFDFYVTIGSACAVAITFLIITHVGNMQHHPLFHASMMYAVIIIYAFAGLRFYSAVIAGWSGGLIAAFMSLLTHQEIDWTVLHRTYTFSSLLGMSLAYAIDRQHRENYLQNCIIEVTQAELTQQAEELSRLSQQDSLTGLANRRHLNEVLEKEWRWAQRHHMPMTIMMIDIDYFKAYNDTLGHLAGDECIKRISHSLKTVTSRSHDLAARYGGEEFMLVLPMTDVHEAQALSRHVISLIRQLNIPHPASQVSDVVTISTGVATLIPTQEDDLAEFIVRADRALYLAKSEGRNQYQIAS